MVGAVGDASTQIHSNAWSMNAKDSLQIVASWWLKGNCDRFPWGVCALVVQGNGGSGDHQG